MGGGRGPSATSRNKDRLVALTLAEARTLLAVARRAVLVDTTELDVVARLSLLLLAAERQARP